MKSKRKNEPKSIFVLRMIYSRKKIKYPTQLQSETLGYFTDLEKAEHFITYPHKDMYWFLEDHPFKIYEIEEHGTDYFLMEMRVRIYDSKGIFYGEQLSEYDDGYWGRARDDCRFKPGDFVEFIDGMNRFDAGIVVGQPPDPKSVKEISKNASSKKFRRHPFDSSDDCYFVLKGFGRFDHDHPQVFRVFQPSGKIRKTLKRHLTIRYQKCVSGLNAKK